MIEADLEMLYKLKQDAEAARANYEQLRKQIEAKIPPEVVAELADLEAEFSPSMKLINDRIFALENQLKGAVIAGGSTVKSEHVTVSFVRGRVNWDTAALDGYLIDHPELKRFRDEGQPSARVSYK